MHHINRVAFSEVPESRRLFILNILCAEYVEAAHIKTQRRLNFLHSLKHEIYGGWGQYNPETQTLQVAVVWSGRDCDGTLYQNEVHLVNATAQEVDAHINLTYEWADGPCHFYITSLSEASQLRYSSRDLALEAHENGHRHVLRP